jgi:hypothetical membrane protein
MRMELNPVKVPISSISGIAAILIFCSLLLAAISLFPGGISPVDNWISDLGNSNLNPGGSGLFNGACMIAGGLMIIFFAGFYQWYTIETWRNAFVVVAQIAGAFAGLSLFMVGYYPETFVPEHFMWSAAFFVSSFVAMLLANAGLLTHLGYDRVTVYSGAAAVAVSLVFIAGMAAGLEFPVFEWLSVGLLLAWAALMSYNMYRWFK